MQEFTQSVVRFHAKHAEKGAKYAKNLMEQAKAAKARDMLEEGFTQRAAEMFRKGARRHGRTRTVKFHAKHAKEGAKYAKKVMEQAKSAKVGDK